MYTLVDFFAGSGLVSLGLSSHFKTIWANDIDKIKGTVYNNNIIDNKIYIEDISKIDPNNVPCADLYWASFPCQDLSLAGNYDGISGSRSSLVNEFIRIVDAKNYSDRPQVIVLENVYGLISSNRGHDFIYVHSLLTELGYYSGAVVIDASYWVPQSRVRVFFIAIKKELNLHGFVSTTPNWAHPASLVKLANQIDDFIYWSLPEPEVSRKSLKDIIDRQESIDLIKSKHFLSLIPKNHFDTLKQQLAIDNKLVFSGYKRTRSGQQTLEIRFDEIGGCLRTASGGSSKQLLIFQQNGQTVARYMSSREAARLMGAPDSFWLPSNKNDAYTAMGDAVALPVTRYLSSSILSKLLKEELNYAYAT